VHAFGLSRRHEQRKTEIDRACGAVKKPRALRTMPDFISLSIVVADRMPLDISNSATPPEWPNDRASILVASEIDGCPRG
jgi:hypothetical protein